MSTRVVPDPSRPCVVCGAPSTDTRVLGESLDVYSTERRCRDCLNRQTTIRRELHLEAEIKRLCGLLADAEAQTPKWLAKLDPTRPRDGESIMDYVFRQLAEHYLRKEEPKP